MEPMSDEELEGHRVHIGTSLNINSQAAARLLAEVIRLREIKKIESDNRLSWLIDKVQADLDDASEERYRFLKERESEAERWKAEGDMYGWNFHQGMAGGANWCDIFYRRIGRALDEEKKKLGSTIAAAAGR